MLLSLAFMVCADSLTTFRRRPPASPTSIPEIEATHPHVNPLRPARVGRPSRGIHPTVRAVRPHPRVVIVGAGFGGLLCARALRGGPVDVTIVDRQNYHLFTPLLYQVASCLLNPSEITAPIRKVFHGVPNV